MAKLVFNPVSGDFDLVNDAHGSLTGLTSNDDHTQYLRLAGRTGTANDFTISTTGNGHIVGSALAARHINIKSNSVTPNTGEIQLEAGIIALQSTNNVPPVLSMEDGTGFVTSFVAQTQAANLAYTLPATSTAGALTNNGAGLLSWETISGTNAWLQGGNSPTTSGILGTLDNIDFHIVRNGQYRVNIFDNVVRISGIIEGGGAVGQDLVLRPNPHNDYNTPQNGFIRLNGRIRNTESFTPTQVLGSMINFINNWGTTNLEAVFPTAYRTQSSGKYNYTTTGAQTGPGGLLAFDCNNTVEKTASGIDVGTLTKWQAAEMRHRWRYNSQGAGGTRIFGNYQAAGSVDNVNSTNSGLATIDRYYGFGMSSFSPSPINYVGAGVTVDEFDGFWMPAINYSGTIGEIYGLGVDDQAGTIGTRRAAVRSSLTRRVGSDGVVKNYGLWFPGSAPNVVAGVTRFGDTDNPVPTLSGIDVAGQIQVGNTLNIVASGVYNWIQANGDAVSGPEMHTLFVAPGAFTRGYYLSGRIDFSRGNPSGTSSGALFAFNSTFAAAANNRTMSNFQGFANNGAFTPETFSGITGWNVRTLNHAPVIGSLVGSATHAEYPRVTGVICQGSVLNPTNGSVIITDWDGIHFNPPSVLGTDRINRITVLEVEDITVGITRRSLWSKGSSVDLVNAGAGVFGANSGVSNSSVGLELNSATKAFLPSRLTTGAVNALTPIDGMFVYDTTAGTHKARKAGAWVDVPGSGSGPTIATDVVTGSTDTIPNGSDLTANTVTTTPGEGKAVILIASLTHDKSSSTNKQVALKMFKDGSEINSADRYIDFNDAGSTAASERTCTGHWVITSETAGSHTYTFRLTEEAGGANLSRRLQSRLTVMY